MVRAHRQAWAWQDEWYGMTMNDIRELERQTQEALRKKMAGDEDDDEGEDYEQDDSRESVKESPLIDTSTDDQKSVSAPWADPGECFQKSPKVTVKISDLSGSSVVTDSSSTAIHSKGSNISSPGSKSSKNFEVCGAWKVEGLMKKETDSEGSDEEFFDCLGIRGLITFPSFVLIIV